MAKRKRKKAEFPGDDPLGLASVDREIRIAKLREQIKEATGEDVMFGTGTNCPPEIEEEFLKHVLAYETAEAARPIDELKRAGLVLPPADELDDETLNAKLWELIRAMAEWRLFLHCTDHLSDRELYAHLIGECLQEEFIGFGELDEDCHIDLISSGSDEDIQLNLRYYADDDERAYWGAEYPEDPMPPKEKLPFDRDRKLPRAGE